MDHISIAHKAQNIANLATTARMASHQEGQERQVAALDAQIKTEFDLLNNLVKSDEKA